MHFTYLESVFDKAVPQQQRSCVPKTKQSHNNKEAMFLKLTANHPMTSYPYLHLTNHNQSLDISLESCKTQDGVKVYAFILYIIHVNSLLTNT